MYDPSRLASGQRDTRGCGNLVSVAGLLAAMLALSGCNMFERLTNVGEEPTLTAEQNPTQRPEYQPVSLPMPDPVTAQRQANSLWRPGARHFFRDQRAGRIGDILTINIAIDNEEGNFVNDVERTRDMGEQLGIGNVLGFESELTGWLPPGFVPQTAVRIGQADADGETNAGETSRYVGAGEIDRSETVNLAVAAIVTQVLPNGNLVVQGRQEVRVNFEVREVVVGGIIRPEDITPNNEIAHTQIAELRLAYGGRGTLSDVQQPRYGQQILDVILPF